MNEYTTTITLTVKADSQEEAADFGWALVQELREAHADSIGPICNITTQEHKQ